MRRQGLCYALIALAFLSLLIAGACSPPSRFYLAALDHQDITASIRKQVDASVPFAYGNLVYRAFYEQEDYVVVAYTYTILNVGVQGQQGFGVGAFSVDPGAGVAERLGGANIGVFHLQYGWGYGSVGSEDTRIEYAGGWALSQEAHRAVVSTSRGRTIEAQIVDGVWLARIEVDPSGLEKLLSATVMDEGGRVLFTDRRY